MSTSEPNDIEQPAADADLDSTQHEDNEAENENIQAAGNDQAGHIEDSTEPEGVTVQDDSKPQAQDDAAPAEQPAAADQAPDAAASDLVTCPVCQYQFQPGAPVL